MASVSRRSAMGFSNLSAIFLLFCLFSASAQAASAVLGIDFGTEYIKAALVKPGIPLDIVLTKDSRRKETSAVCFKPVKNSLPGSFPERVYGSDAVALAARFPGDVYPNIKTLLGLPSGNTKVVDYASRHPALKLETLATRGTAAFRSGAFEATEEPFSVEEILAMEFQSIQKNAEALAGKGSSIKDIVVTIPPFYSIEEKKAIEMAADLAGLRVLSLISDGLAVGLNYATTRQFPSITEGGSPEHHLVFDMGAGSTKATVLKFQGKTVKDVGKFNKTIQEVHVLGTGWDRTLGGDALNAIIVDDMMNKFVDSKAAKKASVALESVQAHGRAQAKLWKDAERLRQILSANAEAQSSFEGLFDEVDFRYKITRAEFEELTSSFAERVYPAIETACDRAHIEIKDLDSIILHGGAVRTPFIQKQLEKIAGSADKIRSNVNADEAAVFGAGFKGAGLSPSFRVKDIRTFEAAGYGVGMKWINIHAKPQHQQIFNPQSHLGVEKTVSFQNQKDFPIQFYQHVPGGENVSPGSAEKELITLTTQNLTAGVAELKAKGCTDGDILAKFGVRLNGDHGHVEITKAVLHCELEEEEKKDSVVDSVKGLFGFGSKKEGQEILDDSETLEATGTESKSTTSTTSSSTSSASASAKGVKDAKDAKDTKPKMTKRLHAITIDYTIEVQGYPSLPASEITRMKTRLADFDDSDRSRRLREESLNQLEGFTYRVRDMISDEKFTAASTSEERASLEEKSSAASEWLYGEGADAPREELKAKLKELKDIVSPIEKRLDESAKRPEAITNLENKIEQTKTFINNIKVQIAAANEQAQSSSTETSTSSTTTESVEPSSTAVVDSEFEGLEDEDTTTTSSSTTSSVTPKPTPPAPAYTAEDLLPVQELLDSASEWLAAKIAEQDALPPTADPILLVQDIAQKANELNSAGVDLVMKGVRSKPTSSSSSSRSKTSKTTKSKKEKKTKTPKKGGKGGSKDKSADDMPDIPGMPEGMKMFKVGEDGAMNEEDILEAMGRDRNGDAEWNKDEL